MKLKELPIEQLPKSRKFKKLRNMDQLEICYNFLLTLISDQNYKDTKSVTEFLEVSAKSFTNDEKYKEGYVFKIGGGRFSNQHKCFTCYNSGTRITKRWFRVSETGIEILDDHHQMGVVDVIFFSKQFELRAGKRDTQYNDGVRVITSQHNVIFRTGNVQKRDE